MMVARSTLIVISEVAGAAPRNLAMGIGRLKNHNRIREQSKGKKPTDRRLVGAAGLTQGIGFEIARTVGNSHKWLE